MITGGGFEGPPGANHPRLPHRGDARRFPCWSGTAKRRQRTTSARRCAAGWPSPPSRLSTGIALPSAAGRSAWAHGRLAGKPSPVLPIPRAARGQQQRSQSGGDRRAPKRACPGRQPTGVPRGEADRSAPDDRRRSAQGRMDGADTPALPPAARGRGGRVGLRQAVADGMARSPWQPSNLLQTSCGTAYSARPYVGTSAAHRPHRLSARQPDGKMPWWCSMGNAL